MRRTTRCLAFTLAVLLTLATACSSSGDDGGSSANAAGSEESAGGEDAAGTSAADLTTEQCEALQALGPDDIDSVADELSDQLVDELRRYAEELEAWQAEGTDPTTPQPTPGDELQAAYDHCVELLDLAPEVPDAGEAFFGYHSMQITGDTAVVTVAGSCRDGSIPTDVEMSLPLGGTVPGTDVGAGNFEFTVDVTDTADEEGLIAELGLDADTIDLTVSGTCG